MKVMNNRVRSLIDKIVLLWVGVLLISFADDLYYLDV